MLYQPTKEAELAPALRTMVQLLLVGRALQVLVQSLQVAKILRAEVARVGLPVPGGLGGPRVDAALRAVCVGVCEQFLRDKVLGVLGADGVVDFLPRDARGAGAGFEVDGHGGDRREEARAANASDLETGM